MAFFFCIPVAFSTRLRRSLSDCECVLLCMFIFLHLISVTRMKRHISVCDPDGNTHIWILMQWIWYEIALKLKSDQNFVGVVVCWAANAFGYRWKSNRIVVKVGSICMRLLVVPVLSHFKSADQPIFIFGKTTIKLSSKVSRSHVSTRHAKDREIDDTQNLYQ